MRPSALALFALALLAVLAWGCHEKIQARDCARMLDRYIDMIALADPAAQGLPPAQAAAVREAKKARKKAEARYVHVEAQCEADVTRREFDCAMAAKNPDEWEACIE